MRAGRAARPGVRARRLPLIAAAVAAIAVAGCAKNTESLPPLTRTDSLRILDEVSAHRAEVDSAFRLDPDSPFNRDTTIVYSGIKWFPPDLRYYFRSRLFRYRNPEGVTVMGTKGEQRSMVKYGYFILSFGGKEWRLNAYKSTSADRSLSVWFTDSTTGHETYHVGRYVDVGEEDADPAHVYVIDLNDAYNPYCAYSGLYTCAIPRREDHLDFAVRAGEMNYHR